MEPLPSGPPASTSPTGRLVDAARRAAAPLFAVLGALWLVEAVDSVVLDDRLQANGIRPRDVDGLVGIVAAPFLHGSWGHLIANSVPFVVLGGLVLLRGRALWTGVTVFVMLAGGALTWLVGRSANHIGASGVVFGYLGFLVAAAVL
ncbi:MAG: rhomboid family intramembrane serine protease, partial [Acidimicrobiia bacterium]|nr:rhomboid family intramembrane serine protease [Acidimicrobiia bacterium]